jgi:basic membrane lipoprotein Med (substrate-binding protein (PBP1-ABC) superfamily)
VYTAFQACLLTGANGLADPAAAPLWAGMQDASLATHAKVSYLAVAGPQTDGNAEPYANTLVQRHCSLVIGAGRSQVDAVETVAKANSHARFAVAGGAAAANVTALASNPSSAERSSIASLIRELAK